VAILTWAAKEACYMVQVKHRVFSFFFKHPLQYARLQTAMIKDAALVLFPLEEWQE